MMLINFSYVANYKEEYCRSYELDEELNSYYSQKVIREENA